MKKIKVYFVCTHLPNCNFQIKICNFSYGPKAIYLHDHSIFISKFFFKSRNAKLAGTYKNGTFLDIFDSLL